MTGASRVAVSSSNTSMRRCGRRPWWRCTTCSSRSASRSGTGTSTRIVFRSAQAGKSSWKIALPHSSGTTRLAARSNGAARAAWARAERSGVVVVLRHAGTADHDLVLLDRDLHRTVTGPVLGVHRVVLDRGVEPQPVALLAVVERTLERLVAAAAGAPATGAPAARLWLRVGLIPLGFRLGLCLGGLAGRLLGGAGVLLGLAGGLGLQLGGDHLVVLRAQIDLFADGAVLVTVRFEALFSLEGLDLLYGRFELMSDPCVGAPLAHPGTDLI